MCLGSSLARNPGTLDGEFGAFERLLRIDCSPTALDWLIDELDLTAEESLLDCGAGVGGPAAYAAQAVGVTPLLVEPEAGGCHAAQTLFGFPGAGGRIRGAGWLMPPSTAWSLGVLCTTPHQLELLTELRRTVRSPGRIALLAFVARQSVSDEQPEGNHFSQSTDLPSWSTMPVSGSTHGEARRRVGPSAGLDWPCRRGHRRPGRAARHVADVAVGRRPQQADR